VIVGEGAAQDTPHHPQPVNVASYGMTGIPPPPSVRINIHTACVVLILLSRCSSMPCQWFNTRITMQDMFKFKVFQSASELCIPCVPTCPALIRSQPDPSL